MKSLRIFDLDLEDGDFRRAILLVRNAVLLLFGCTFLGACLILLRYFIWRRKVSRLIPGIKVSFFSLLGNMNHLRFSAKLRNGHSLMVYAQQFVAGSAKLLTQEKLYCIWLFCHPVVVLAKAEAVELVLSGTKVIEKAWFYKLLQSFFGTGLVTSIFSNALLPSGGNKWKSRRKMLNPCFRYDVLKEYMPILNEQSKILVKLLKAETTKDHTRIFRPLSLCSLDIICETVLGVYLGAQESETELEFIHATKWGMRYVVERAMNCFLWLDFIYYSTTNGKKFKKHTQTVGDFTRNLIRQEKQKYLRGDFNVLNSKRKSFMHLLLEHHLQTKDLTEEDIAEELVTFMVAGHDTTAAAISWTLYLLGLNPAIQQKVHEELDWIYGKEVERDVTVDEFKEMKYLECVIKEALRLYPPVPFLARQIVEDTTICGYQVPKGATCIIFTHNLHRDEKYFPNPEIFDPDRFLPENSADRHPYAYIPFSAGPRNCIGQKISMMEQMTIVSTILRNYTVESVDQRDELLPALTIVTTASKPIKIKIRERHSRK
ncbi:cytochrome P450 4V2 [Caerostris darwini]|uniref:Cytochrome P450 4V2 n=1 Tax=Caerostris darwini TaxID=1538125 RepID=A0AAV4R440_9ARAC|nr:cytochrome P450 4V2 [Caerostris darwini]